MIETVVLIDDDKTTQFINKKVISKYGKFKNILTFTSGKVALKYLKSLDASFIQKPQLILLDLDMPGMNGWEFLEEYKYLDDFLIEHTKLIILTTSNDPYDLERSKLTKEVSGYVNTYLTEPVLDKILKVYFNDLVKQYNNLIASCLQNKN